MPTLENTLNRTKNYPRSAAAKALIAMIEEKDILSSNNDSQQIKKLFFNNRGFASQLRSNYKPGFFRGHFANRTPTVYKVLIRAMRHPKSATAKVLKKMVSERVALAYY